jgi:hypothetical protein
MDQRQFDEIIDRRLKQCREVLVEKSAMYMRNNDKLHNFRSVASRRGITMLEALDGMLAKHVQSFHDIIEDVKAGKPISQHTIDEKFGDITNYHLLAEAIVVEHNEKLNEKP